MAHDLVPSVGFVEYNGVVFPPPKSCRVIGVPVPDTSNRTTKYVAYTVSVESIFMPDDFADSLQNAYGTLDNAVEFLRQRLTATGQYLIFTYQGFGRNVIINDRDATKGDGVLRYDAVFGPHPKLLVWEPIGSNRAVRIVWECEFVIPDICSNPVYAGGIAEYNWEANFSITEDMMSVRTITGTLEIPMTRRGRSLPDTVDTYRDLIRFPRLPGFTRNEDYSISRDKRIINFRITDTEIPSDNPLFPGIINADVDHTISSGLNESSNSGAFQVWIGILRGTFRILPGIKKNYLWLALADLIKQRVTDRVKFGDSTRIDVDGKTQWKKKSFWIPISLELSEKVFGRELSFTFVYRLSSSMETIFDSTGILQPMTGDWNTWTNFQVAYGNRGYAKLTLKATDDKITDLCDPYTVPTVDKVYKAIEYERSIFAPTCPDPEGSWVIYSPRLSLIEDSETEFINKSTGTSPGEITTQTAPSRPEAVGTDLRGIIPQIPQNEKPILQSRGHSRWYLRHSGTAFRVCFKPSIPRIAKVLGVVVGRGSGTHHIDTLHPGSKFPVYRISWDYLYAIPGPVPGNLEDNVEIDGAPERYR